MLGFSDFMEFFIVEHVCCVFFPHRLKKMPQSMPEYALTRNYLELMVELPWNKSTTGEPAALFAVSLLLRKLMQILLQCHGLSYCCINS